MRADSPRLLTLLITALLACPTFAVPALEKSVLSFEKAAKPYAGEKYTLDGYVDRSGKVRNGGLGCSGYASAVLHRMRDGETWLETYDLKVHQLYGDKIAAHFGLKRSATVPATDLQKPAELQSLINDGTLKKGTLYFFNVRKGEHGHVGFVRIKDASSLVQSHYSGIKPYNGLATGNFRDWLKASQYSASDVELYPVPE